MSTNTKDKQREYDHARYAQNPQRQAEKNRQQAARMRKLIREAKQELGGQCARCGFDGDSVALDFHHRRGTKKRFEIGNAIRKGYGWTMVQKEIAKCELICANCHRIEHFSRPS